MSEGQSAAMFHLFQRYKTKQIYEFTWYVWTNYEKFHPNSFLQIFVYTPITARI